MLTACRTESIFYPLNNCAELALLTGSFTHTNTHTHTHTQINN